MRCLVEWIPSGLRRWLTRSRTVNGRFRGKPRRRYPITGHENAFAVKRALLHRAVGELKSQF